MNGEYQKIISLADHLEMIQESHIQSFSRELLPDLETQSMERNLAVGRLEKRIRAFLQNPENHPPLEVDDIMIDLKTRVSTLLKQNRTLEKQVRSHRDEMENSMKRLASGRKVFFSYGSPKSSSNMPRVISVTE